MTRIKLIFNPNEREWCMKGMNNGLCDGILSFLFVIPRGTKEINLCVGERDSKESYPVYLNASRRAVVAYENGYHKFYIYSWVFRQYMKMFGLNTTFYVSVEV